MSNLDIDFKELLKTSQKVDKTTNNNNGLIETMENSIRSLETDGALSGPCFETKLNSYFELVSQAKENINLLKKANIEINKTAQSYSDADAILENKANSV